MSVLTDKLSAVLEGCAAKDFSHDKYESSQTLPSFKGHIKKISLDSALWVKITL